MKDACSCQVRIIQYTVPTTTVRQFNSEEDFPKIVKHNDLVGTVVY